MEDTALNIVASALVPFCIHFSSVQRSRVNSSSILLNKAKLFSPTKKGMCPSYHILTNSWYCQILSFVLIW